MEFRLQAKGYDGKRFRLKAELHASSPLSTITYAGDWLQLDLIRWMRPRRSSASTNIEIAAIPAAPAASVLWKLLGLIPPSAMTGIVNRSTTSRKAARPTGGP